MVGLVIVSHSARLAAGVAELAAQVAGPEVRISTAGGLGGSPGQTEDAAPLGTDATLVVAAIERSWSDDGVLVLMDLGSAVLSAELAMDLLDEGRRDNILLAPAPLVEGAVAAAVCASLGQPLQAVAAAAQGGLAAKEEQLPRIEIADAPRSAPQATYARPAAPIVVPAGPGEADPPAEQAGATLSGDTALSTRITVRNRLGLHARPAALLIRTLAPFDATLRLSILNSNREPADARSLTAIVGLGVCGGDVLLAEATGPDAAAALAALERLAAEGFGEPDDLVEVPTAAAPSAVTIATKRPVTETVLGGIAAAPGVALGPAWLLHHATRSTGERAGVPTDDSAPSHGTVPADAHAEDAGSAGTTDDPASEWAALEIALQVTATELREARAAVEARGAGDEAAIFDAQLLLLDDPGLLDPIRDAVLGAGESAGRAWSAAINRAVTAWESLPDQYPRERAADIRHVGDLVLGHLATPGRSGRMLPPPDSAAVVIVTDELTAAEVAGFVPGTVAAIVTAGGGRTAHATILAAALGLPVVVGAGATVLEIADGTPLLVDGGDGRVIIAPSQAEREAAEREAADTRAERRRTAEPTSAAALAAQPAVTRDGVTVAVEANVSTVQEARAAADAGADGVGLLRTELLFLDAAAFPDEDRQAAAYEAVAAALNGRPLTIRTLDAGADKPLPSLPSASERNPYLGVRGLRLSLRHPDLLLTQLKAVLRVATAHPVRVMFPMVAEVEELRRALEVLGEARAALGQSGPPPTGPGGTSPATVGLKIGVMVEVPSAALLAEHLAPLVDFFSVGTNDLTQYAMAAERGNPDLTVLSDPLHPAVLRLIATVCAAADAAGRAVAVCGEAAGDPAAVPLLIGLGVRELSMGAVRIAAAKDAVRSTDLTAARALAERALATDSAAAVRTLINAPAKMQ